MSIARSWQTSRSRIRLPSERWSKWRAITRRRPIAAPPKDPIADLGRVRRIRRCLTERTSFDSTAHPAQEQDGSRTFSRRGPQAVREALRMVGCVQYLLVTRSSAEKHRELTRTAATAGVAVRITADDVLASLTDTSTPQGVVAV